MIGSDSATHSLELCVLGPLQVLGPSGELVVGSQKQRRLLAALLVQTGSVVSNDRLIDILWGETPPRSALNALQTYVARLRNTLGAVADDGCRIVSRAPGYVLEAEPDRIDAHRFELALGRAREKAKTNPDTVEPALQRALGWWRGPAYAEFADEDFARSEAVRLEELRLNAIELRSEALLALGRSEEAASALEVLVHKHPLREDAQALLMTALSRAGRGPEALDVYRQLRALLRDELGLDPSARLQELQRDILAGVAEVDPIADIRTRGTLPPAGPSLVGREEDRSAIHTMLGRHQVVTLTGPGGVGKTALGLQARADSEALYPDGAWFCELAPVRSAEAVPYAIAACLRVVLQPDEAPKRALTAALGHRRLLLVLDNCEHLLDAVAPIVEEIIRTCPGITVLATSRERLGVGGEFLWPVQPLGVPEAVQLLAARAESARPNFEVTSSNASMVEDVCKNLDGLPLALELAAARMGALTLEDVAERLGRRLDLLAHSGRAAESRHRTLRAVVDWSFELLTDSERRLFERLSVFAGGFTLAQIEKVCTDQEVASDDAAGLLADLVEKSMVVRPDGDASGRYRMLETLRGYAQERLGRRDEAEVFSRAQALCMVAFAEDAAEKLKGADEATWFIRIETEIDNLRVAHLWALARGDADVALRLSASLHRFGFWRMRYEVLGWAAFAAEVSGAQEHALLPVVLASAGVAAWTRGDLAQAGELARRALDASERGSTIQGLPSEALGDVAMFGGSHRDADALYAKSVQAYRQVGDAQSEVWGLASQAMSLAYGGAVDGASERAAETRRVARDSVNPTTQALALFAEGESLLDHDPDRAVALLQEAGTVAASSGNEFIAGVVAVSVASLLGRHGDSETALRSFGSIIDRWQRTGNWMQQWTTLRNLADLFVRLGDDEPAAILYGAAAGAQNVASVYGPEAERLERAEKALGERLGPRLFGDLAEKGRRMSGVDCVELASREIERILTARSS